MNDPRTLTFAVLGLGEAGSLIARDLVHGGATVRGWDPDLHGDLSEIPIAASSQAAIAGADVVISINWATAAEEVAREAFPQLRPDMLYAEHNTAGPALKERVAAIVEPAGARFVDVAMMAPVPGLGLRVPMFLAGSGAAALASVYRAFGTPIGFIGDRPGEANARKLARSIFYKGLGTSIVEALEVGRATGIEEWLRSDITATLLGLEDDCVARLDAGSRKHAKRRGHEMRDAAELAASAGVEPIMATAAARTFERLVEERAVPH